MGLFDGLAEAKRQKAQDKGFEESRSKVIGGTGSSIDYNIVVFRFHEENDFENILKYINEYKLKFDDRSEAFKFFEAKGLFGLNRYDEAESLLNELIQLWDRTHLEFAEITMWLAIINRNRGNLEVANELRNEAIKLDRRNGNRLRIKSLPW